MPNKANTTNAETSQLGKPVSQNEVWVKELFSRARVQGLILESLTHFEAYRLGLDRAIDFRERTKSEK